MYKALIFDLDGTLTEPRQEITEEMCRMLDSLQYKYILGILGAGSCKRIYNQIKRYSSIYIMGDYGLEFSRIAYGHGLVSIYREESFPKFFKTKKVFKLIRKKYGLTKYYGQEYDLHPTGIITFALLGTDAKIEDKIKFDPDKKRREQILPELQQLLPNNNVIIGGTSSFDILPKGIDKSYGIQKYLQYFDLQSKELLYFGDDFEHNDNGIVKTKVDYVKVKNSSNLIEVLNGYTK
jgi:HAD superfamily hydrolase (TIGR01484 family)